MLTPEQIQTEACDIVSDLGIPFGEGVILVKKIIALGMRCAARTPRKAFKWSPEKLAAMHADPVRMENRRQRARIAGVLGRAALAAKRAAARDAKQ